MWASFRIEACSLDCTLAASEWVGSNGDGDVGGSSGHDRGYRRDVRGGARGNLEKTQHAQSGSQRVCGKLLGNHRAFSIRPADPLDGGEVLEFAEGAERAGVA